MVEGAPLLREYTGNGIEGSNPFVSAIKFPAEILFHHKINDLIGARPVLALPLR